MRKLVMLFCLLIMASCGSGLDGEEETYLYTFILKNETGVNVIITGDSPQRIEELQNGQSFSCSYSSIPNTSTGICEDYVFLFFPKINKGYKCFGSSDDIGLCFEGGQGLFTKLKGTIFTEVSTRTYEYVLAPDLLENAFELPE
ncbi:MAG: hypothetical protein VX798_15330 [Bacteroidota bacterium]|nr:hypothetical protein [Bacteroidota bacterium]